MLFLRKLLLPSPVDLKWSTYNALQDENFSKNPTGKTWQDWHRTVKSMYPVKYFIAETLPKYINYVYVPIINPIKEIYYWLKSHINNEHMIDLRQPKSNKYNIDYYNYGYIEPSTAMLFAIFNILDNYVNSSYFISHFNMSKS